MMPLYLKEKKLEREDSIFTL